MSFVLCRGQSMVKKWVHPSEQKWDDTDIPPADEFDETPAERWLSDAERARAGDPVAVFLLWEELARFLHGHTFANAVHDSPEVRAVLAEKLTEALSADSKQVGATLGLGQEYKKKLPRAGRYDRLQQSFIPWAVRKMQDLNLTSRDSLPFAEAVSWVKQNAEGVEERVHDDTIRTWIQQARHKLYAIEVFGEHLSQIDKETE